MPRAKVNGINIDYEICGSGEPVIMIQGLGGPRVGWTFQKRAFSWHYRVVLFDNRGVGRSDKPVERYTIKTMADDAIGLMDHLGIESAHVMGTSMGGMIAQELAINYPERVRKLVLVCTTAGMEDDSLMRLKHQKMLGLGDGTVEANLDNIDVKTMGRVMANITGLAFSKLSFRIFLVPVSKIYFRFSSIVEGILGQMKAVADYSTVDRLHLIKAPTLVIVGTGDRILPSESSDLLASRIPDARLVRIEGGSHSFFMEKRGEFNRVVLNFLRGS